MPPKSRRKEDEPTEYASAATLSEEELVGRSIACCNAVNEQLDVSIDEASMGPISNELQLPTP